MRGVFELAKHFDGENPGENRIKSPGENLGENRIESPATKQRRNRAKSSTISSILAQIVVFGDEKCDFRHYFVAKKKAAPF